MKTDASPWGVVNGRYAGKNGLYIWVDRGPFVFKKAKNPDIFQRWQDFLYTPEIGVQAAAGMEGVHLIKTPSGQYDQNPNVPAPYASFGEWGGATHVQLPSYFTEWLAEPMTRRNKESMEYRQKNEFYRPYFINEPMPPMAQTNAEAEKINGYPDIKKLVDDMTSQWIAGVRDIERDWPDYLRQLDQMGLKDYIAAYQSYVTRVRNRLGSSY
jgi:putative aldouronate transport system substrate-binding protein